MFSNVDIFAFLKMDPYVLQTSISKSKDTQKHMSKHPRTHQVATNHWPCPSWTKNGWQKNNNISMKSTAKAKQAKKQCSTPKLLGSDNGSVQLFLVKINLRFITRDTPGYCSTPKWFLSLLVILLEEILAQVAGRPGGSWKFTFSNG